MYLILTPDRERLDKCLPHLPVFLVLFSCCFPAVFSYSMTRQKSTFKRQTDTQTDRQRVSRLIWISFSHFPGPVFLLFFTWPDKRVFLRDRQTDRQTVRHRVSGLIWISSSHFPGPVFLLFLAWPDKGAFLRDSQTDRHRVYLIYPFSSSCFPAVHTMTNCVLWETDRQSI